MNRDEAELLNWSLPVVVSKEVITPSRSARNMEQATLIDHFTVIPAFE